MRRGRRPWHRRAFAATAAVLWLLGVEVLPNLHLATHHHDHTHAAGGAIVSLGHGPGDVDHAHDHAGADHTHVETAPHEHHAGCDDLAALDIAHEEIVLDPELDDFDPPRAAPEPDPAPPRRDERLAIDNDTSPGHAALGIAHHATALHQPPPPLLAPVATPNVVIWTHPAPKHLVASAARARPTARGPPVA